MPPVVDSRPLRWLIAAPLSASPEGRKIAVSGERFTTIMGAVSVEATVEVPDRLGSDATRTVSLGMKRPRDFRTRELVGKLDPLRELSAVADKLAKDGDVGAAVTKIRAVVGDGRLVDALEGREPEPAVVRKEPAPAAAPAPAPEADSDPDDPIFGKAALAPESRATSGQAKNAVGSFISAIRSSSAPSKAGPATASGRAAAPTVRETLDATARDVLATPAVSRLERAWRALRMVMASCPAAEDLGVDAVDTDDVSVVAAVTRALDAEPWQRADAVFVVEPIGDFEVLRALASLADERRVPIVVEIPPGAVGLGSDGESVDDAPPAWTELRAHTSCAWLCAIVGQPALAHESDGGERTVFGGGAAAVAAMSAASVAHSGTPAAIVGKAGALVAPAAHTVGTGPDRQTIPTRTFVAYRTQLALAQRGVAALGSEADSDRLRLAAAPMVGGEMALPGRILAGRAHRLAAAVRQALGPGASTQELERALDEASGAFLPRIGAADVTLRVRDAAPDGQGDGVRVDASIGAALAGASVTFSSDV